jgi:hypothetical protein
MFLRNVDGLLLDYTALHTRRQRFSYFKISNYLFSHICSQFHCHFSPQFLVTVQAMIRFMSLVPKGPLCL